MKVGWRYRTRRGRIVQVGSIHKDSSGNDYWHGKFLGELGTSSTWYKGGTYWSRGDKSGLDLVEVIEGLNCECVKCITKGELI